MNRILPMVTIAACVVLALPATASAAPPAAVECRSVLKRAPAPAIDARTPWLVLQEGSAGWTGGYITSSGPGTATRLTHCSFLDRDRDGRYDARTDALWTYRASWTSSAEYPAIWRYRVEYTGAVEGDRVCDRTLQQDRPLAGGKPTRDLSRTSCFDIHLYTPE